MTVRIVCLVLILSGLSQCCVAQNQNVTVHRLTSPRQATETTVRVLTPDRMEDGRRYAVVYVLPVEAADGTRWGNCVDEFLRLDISNRFQLICVFPTFSALPWYADHPVDPLVQQESYLLKDVVPLVEQSYPVSNQAQGRLLLGFSKSGWGAWSLLLRHPETFLRAAAFDAPMMMDAPGKYGSGPIFGSDDNFQHYHITRLLTDSVLRNQTSTRLMLIGRGNFDSEHTAVVKLAQQHHISVKVDNAEQRQHSWHSGWVLPAVQWLVAE